jgi:hypothetical protein
MGMSGFSAKGSQVRLASMPSGATAPIAASNRRLPM